MKQKNYITAGGWAYEQLKESAQHMRKYPTPAENMLWQALRNEQLGVKFRRQQIIENYIVDFVCLEKQLILEIDGKYHGQTEQQRWDEQRTKHLEALGYQVIRFENGEILLNIENTLKTIKEFL